MSNQNTDSEICVGLFGTCGASQWRNTFIAEYNQRNILFFNPQVPDGTWSAGMVHDENRHFNTDQIILFPVTSETTGQGSMAEIGFSIINALRQNRNRYFIFLVDDICLDHTASQDAVSDSNRSRQLVKSKLITESLSNDNIFLVQTLDDMLKLSVLLYDSLLYTQQLKTRIAENIHIVDYLTAQEKWCKLKN